MSDVIAECALCSGAGGIVLWRDDRLRVVLVDESDYPGFCRVIWHAHIREMSDLAAQERGHVMAVVFEVEALLREVLNPDKINLASLGNLTPHLHWHVIPRWRDDPQFPGSIWSERLREPPVRASADLDATLRARLAVRLGRIVST
ncbi:MAG: HIT family protein [Burkholderiales bacterium]